MTNEKILGNIRKRKKDNATLERILTPLAHRKEIILKLVQHYHAFTYAPPFAKYDITPIALAELLAEGKIERDKHTYRIASPIKLSRHQRKKKRQAAYNQAIISDCSKSLTHTNYKIGEAELFDSQQYNKDYVKQCDNLKPQKRSFYLSKAGLVKC
jgi:hypothetical protein